MVFIAFMAFMAFMTFMGIVTCLMSGGGLLAKGCN